MTLNPLRWSLGNVPTTKTEYGQTGTQSALPSQRLRSMTGMKTPGSCLQVVVSGMGSGCLYFIRHFVEFEIRGDFRDDEDDEEDEEINDRARARLAG